LSDTVHMRLLTAALMIVLAIPTLMVGVFWLLSW
jgi:hypothetical protein